MPDEITVAQRDYTQELIEGARRPAGIQRNDSTDQWPGMQSERFVQASSADLPAVSARQFTIRSVRIDNLSNQWLRMGSNWDIIPPYTTGVVVNVRGLTSVSVVREVPPGMGAAPAAIAGEQYFITLYDRPQIPQSSQHLAPTSSVLFDNLALSPQFVATQYVEIISATLLYTASGVVGNRRPRLTHFAPADIAYRVLCQADITAGLTITMAFGQGVPFSNPTAANPAGTGPIPVGMRMSAGDTLGADDQNGVSGADSIRMVIYGRAVPFFRAS